MSHTKWPFVEDAGGALGVIVGLLVVFEDRLLRAKNSCTGIMLSI